MSMSMTAKAAWAALWMQCDDHGIFEWKPIVLKALIFPADNVDFAEVLAEFESLDCVKRIEVNGKPCGLVRNFAKYQRPKNPSYRHFTDATFPAEYGSYVALKGSTPPVLPQSYPSTTEIPPQMKEEGGKREEVSRSKPTERKPSRFDEFWQAYPRRDGPNPRKDAEKKFDGMVKSGVDPQTMIDAARQLAADEARRGNIGTRFIPQAITWLNGQRWIDHAAEVVDQTLADDGHIEVMDEDALAAWDAYRMAKEGRKFPRNKRGGWRFPTQFPPGHVPRETNHDPPQIKMQAMS